MTWERLDLQVRWMFEEVQRLAPTHEHIKIEDTLNGVLHESLESIRKAYRDRNRAEGRCRSCPRPRANGTLYCDEHLAKKRENNRRAWQRRKASLTTSTATESQRKT